MVKSHLSKKLWGLVKMTLGLVHTSYSLPKGQAVELDFLNCYSNIMEEKKGPHRFPNKTPLLRVHWAADCPLQWFKTLRSTFV